MDIGSQSVELSLLIERFSIQFQKTVKIREDS